MRLRLDVAALATGLPTCPCTNKWRAEEHEYGMTVTSCHIFPFITSPPNCQDYFTKNLSSDFFILRFRVLRKRLKYDFK